MCLSEILLIIHIRTDEFSHNREFTDLENGLLFKVKKVIVWPHISRCLDLFLSKTNLKTNVS